MLRRALAIAVCLLVALLPAFSLAEQSFTMAGFDGQESPHDWTTNQFFTRMETRTGITFTFNQFTDTAKWQQAKDSMFATGELPDVLFKAALTDDEQLRYAQSGQLIDLLPLLPENAPNLWALLQANPAWLSAITLSNGMVVALPEIQTSTAQNALWINKTWLDALNLDVPTDFTSLRAVLEAFRDRDPNLNGRADEIPLTFLGPWELKFFSHAYGVVANDYNIYLDDAKQVHFWPMEDSFIELAKTMRDFYANKLLDQTGFRTADSLRRITDEEATLTYGAFFAPSPLNLLVPSMAEQYVLVEPFAYEGKQIYRNLLGPVRGGTFAITSACEDPAALLRWVDVLYTEEGAIEAMVGYQGESYTVDANGYWQLLDMDTAAGMSIYYDLTVYDTGHMPWLYPNDFNGRYGDESARHLQAELDKMDGYVVDPFPAVKLASDQRATVTSIQIPLATYMDETLAKFVMGQLELTDETISAFRAELQSLGAQDMIDFWQGVADAN